MSFMVAKIQRLKSIRISWLAVFSVLLTVTHVYAQDFTQGYATDDRLLRGSVVARNESDENKVDSANLEAIDRLFGIVVQSNESALTLTSDTSGVFVATSGRFEVLVSNVNGEIKKDDYVTASAIQGIAMKATKDQDLTLGQALQTFDANDPNNILSTTRVTDANGNTFDVAVGRILVEVDVKRNPLKSVGSAPDFLLRFGETVAGEAVSPIKIYASVAALFVTLGLGGSMLYAGIRSSIVAIGRNPLSRNSVLKGFSRVALTSITIFLTGFFAIYLILRL